MDFERPSSSIRQSKSALIIYEGPSFLSPAGAGGEERETDLAAFPHSLSARVYVTLRRCRSDASEANREREREMMMHWDAAKEKLF